MTAKGTAGERGTPRTDASYDHVPEWGQMVSADFARQLETELTLATAKIEELERRIKNYEPVSLYNGLSIDQWKERAEAAEAQLTSQAGELQRAREKVIEECAKVCDDYAALQNSAWVQPKQAIMICARNIRALSDQPKEG